MSLFPKADLILSQKLIMDLCKQFYVDGTDMDELIKKYQRGQLDVSNIVYHILHLGSGYPNHLSNTPVYQKITKLHPNLKVLIKKPSYDTLIMHLVNMFTEEQIKSDQYSIRESLNTGNNYMALWLLEKGFPIIGDNHIASLEAMEISNAMGCDFTKESIHYIVHSYEKKGVVPKMRFLLELHPEYVQDMPLDDMFANQDVAIYLFDNFPLPRNFLEEACRHRCYDLVDHMYRRGVHITFELVCTMANLYKFEEMERWCCRFRCSQTRFVEPKSFSDFIPFILKSESDGDFEEISSALEELVKMYPETLSIVSNLKGLPMIVRKYFLIRHELFKEDLDRLIDMDVQIIYDGLDRGYPVEDFIEHMVDIAKTYVHINPKLEDYIRKYSDPSYIKELADEDEFFLDRSEEVSNELH